MRETAARQGERLFVRLEEDRLHGPESSAPAGTIEAFEIDPALRSTISQILICRESLPDGEEVVERVLPDGSARIVVNLGDAPTTGPAPGAPLLAIGASAAPAVVRMRGRVEGLSIALLPGAAAALLGVPAGDLAGTAVPLDQLWGGAGARMLDQVLSAKEDAERVAILQSALASRLRSGAREQARTAARAARLVASAGGGRAVGAIAAELGVGERRLQQLFHEHVGLTPRVWSRLARLHALLRSLRRTGAPDWASVALEHGFYDQAHLAIEVRALSGLTPTELLRRTTSGSSKTPRPRALPDEEP